MPRRIRSALCSPGCCCPSGARTRLIVRPALVRSFSAAMPSASLPWSACHRGEDDDGRGDPARPTGHTPLATRHTQHTQTHTPAMGLASARSLAPEPFPFRDQMPSRAVLPIRSISRSLSPSPYARLGLPAQQTPSNGVAISMQDQQLSRAVSSPITGCRTGSLSLCVLLPPCKRAAARQVR